MTVLRAVSLLAASACAADPPQYPKYYEEKFFEQTADHFNTMSKDTFQHRYLINSTWWGGAPHPIIFYTGAEGPGVDSIFTHSGWVMDVLAPKFKAMVVFGEMRFFGKSMPFGEEHSYDKQPDRLGLLSIEQTLADYNSLIHSIRANHSAQASPVISMGGSLAGTLTTFLRLKYPQAVDMGIASSAPILGYRDLTNEFGWYQVATETFKKQCSPDMDKKVRKAFTDLLDAHPDKITRAFNTCSPASTWTAKDDLVPRITSSMAAMTEASYPKKLSQVIPVCEGLEKHPGVGALAAVIVTPGECTPITPAQDHGKLKLGASSHSKVRAGADWAESWNYLACTEIVHPISSNNVTDMFPPLNSTSKKEYCESEFGVEPRVHWMPESMGMDDLPRFSKSVSRLIFSNGLQDPWSSQSVLHDLSDSLLVVNISDGSHHSDLGGTPNPVPTDDDSESLKSARAKEIEILSKWLQEATLERQPQEVFTV